MVLEGTARAIARETQVHNRRIKRLALVDPGLGVLGMVTGSGPEPMYNLYAWENERDVVRGPLPRCLFAAHRGASPVSFLLSPRPSHLIRRLPASATDAVPGTRPTRNRYRALHLHPVRTAQTRLRTPAARQRTRRHPPHYHPTNQTGKAGNGGTPHQGPLQLHQAEAPRLPSYGLVRTYHGWVERHLHPSGCALG